MAGWMGRWWMADGWSWMQQHACIHACMRARTLAPPAVVGRRRPLKQVPRAVAEAGEDAPVHVLGRGRRDADAVHVNVRRGQRDDLEEVGGQGDLAAQGARAGVVGHVRWGLGGAGLHEREASGPVGVQKSRTSTKGTR